jgi:hypothetical protein
MSATGKTLNQAVGRDGITYLYANSGTVSLVSGAATELLNFRTPNAVSTMKFEIFIEPQLMVAGDIIVIKYFQDAQTVEKLGYKQVSTGGIDGTVPIIINKTLAPNTPFIVEVQYTAQAGSAPTCNSSCNMTGRVY